MELEILYLIQSFAHPVLDAFFVAITVLGEQFMLVPVFCWLYWNTDKHRARAMGFAVFTGVLVNNAVKCILCLPRPIGQPGVRTLRPETATGYAFPSGHTQNFTSFGFAGVRLFAPERRGGLCTAVFGVLAVLVGLSRLYLGVHYPRDVLAGLGLGIVVTWACLALYRELRADVLVTLVLLAGGWFFFNPPGGILDADYCKALGILLGYGLGCAVESRFARFDRVLRLQQKLVRFLPGILLTGALYIGLKILLPPGSYGYLIRYASISFFALGVYPVAFTKLGF